MYVNKILNELRLLKELRERGMENRQAEENLLFKLSALRITLPRDPRTNADDTNEDRDDIEERDWIEALRLENLQY